jgi:protein-S-isoprenylcysteine O-methyltransferase Ste14
MTVLTTTPFNQSIRIVALRGFLLLAFPLIVFTRSQWLDSHMIFDLLEITGVFLIIFGVLGRFWSILYIGGRKNREIMQVGPYSICRHPLYLFSTIATLGFGLMLGSVVLTLFLGLGVFAILNMTASREEAFLRAEFGAAYDAYAARVPRILPRPSLFHTPPEHTFNAEVLRRNGRDALVFLCLIPTAELMEYLHEAYTLPAIPIW